MSSTRSRSTTSSSQTSESAPPHSLARPPRGAFAHANHLPPSAPRRNNHLKQHRAQLRDAAHKFDPPAHLLALHWSFDLPPATVHRVERPYTLAGESSAK